MAHSYEIFSDNKNKLVKTTAALGLSIAALTGCTNAEAPKPTVSASETAKPSSTPTAEAIVTEGTRPTDIPELPVDDTEITESPETSTQSPEAGFAVNYESFADWENKTWVEKNDVCNEFFEANGANTGVELTHQSSGEAIVNWNRGRYEVARDFNLDKSNEQNAIISDNLIECMTKQRVTTDADSKSKLEFRFKGDRNTILDVVKDPLGHVTRYSQDQLFLSGTIAYTSAEGTFDGGIYTARVVEYTEVGELGEEIIQEVLEWDTDTKQWHSVELHDKDAVLNYGPTPVILDQSRLDAPRQF